MSLDWILFLVSKNFCSLQFSIDFKLNEPNIYVQNKVPKKRNVAILSIVKKF